MKYASNLLKAELPVSLRLIGTKQFVLNIFFHESSAIFIDFSKLLIRKKKRKKKTPRRGHLWAFGVYRNFMNIVSLGTSDKKKKL